MRIPHWPALVCGLVLAATFAQTVVAAPPGAVPRGRVALAEAIDDSDEEDEDEPAAQGYYPTQRVQQLGVATEGGVPAVAPVPQGAFVPEGAYAPGMAPPQAWPETSPFSQHRMQETYNSGGLWHFNSDDEFDSKHVLSVEYLYGAGLKPGNHYIGSDRNHNVYFFNGTYGTYNNQTTELFGNVFHQGIKATIGHENPDGTGINISGFILFQNSVDNGLVGYHATAGQIGTLRAMWGIVVDNTDGTGTVLPFDTRFFQKFTQEIWGSDIDFFLSPFFERESFKLKFMWGAKYLRFHEDYYIQADDSGLGYTAGNAGTAGGGGLDSITGPFSTLLPPYSTVISSSTTNNLVGPHLGLRYELGGDKFKIWGQTKLSLAADVEQMTVSSSNVGTFKSPSPLNTTPNVVAGPDVVNSVAVPSTTHKITNTHISPIVDTSIYGEFPGFALIPWVNQWQMFKHAKMRVGWNFVYVGEVARAPGIINYVLHDATINAKRTWFEYSTVNFAVDWRF